MKSVNDRIIVRVNMQQKNEMVIAGVKLKTAMKYESNHREKSPVIAEVVDGNKFIETGRIILCHHNHFYPPSPYFMYDDLFSIPANHTIFSILNTDGSLRPVYGNVFADKVPIESTLPMPPEYRKFHLNRGVITDSGWTHFKVGALVFTRPSAPYDIVYNTDGVERRVTKINSEMICAVA